MRYSIVLLLSMLCLSCAGRKEQVTILPHENNEPLTVSTAQAVHTLQAPYETATITKRGVVHHSVTTADAVQQQYGSVLAVTPGEGKRVTLYFHTGQITLTPESRRTIATLLEYSRQHAPLDIEITGHTDQEGSDTLNDALSLARAEMVRASLMKQGVHTASFRVTGRGARSPVMNTPGQAVSWNRRVEVTVR